MKEKNYEKFIGYLYNEYILPKKRHLIINEDRSVLISWLDDQFEKHTKTSNLLSYINRHCDNEQEVYSTIQKERIVSLPEEVRSNLETTRDILERSGFIEVFDNYYDRIVDGMEMEQLPPQEIEILRRLGSCDPESELAALFYIVKNNSKRMRNCNERNIGYELKSINDLLKKQSNDIKTIKIKLEDLQESPKKTRRWFKGWGKIIRGSGITLTNVASMFLISSIPILDELAGDKANLSVFASSTLGVGTILEGIGELRGE